MLGFVNSVVSCSRTGRQLSGIILILLVAAVSWSSSSSTSNRISSFTLVRTASALTNARDTSALQAFKAGIVEDPTSDLSFTFRIWLLGDFIDPCRFRPWTSLFLPSVLLADATSSGSDPARNDGKLAAAGGDLKGNLMRKLLSETKQGAELEVQISLGSLKRVDLSFFGGHLWPTDLPGKTKPLACSGGTCPNFQTCPNPKGVPGKDENIAACTNPGIVDTDLKNKFKLRNFELFHWSHRKLDPCPKDFEVWRVDDIVSPRCTNPNIFGRTDVSHNGFKGSDEWSGQVLLLRNVFVTWDGLVFNRTHLFSAGGCGVKSYEALSFPPKTKVVRKAAAVNLLQSHDGHARMVVHREIIDKLPLLLSLAPIMPSLRKSGAIFLADTKFLRSVADGILGVPLAAAAESLKDSSHIFFVENLYQPFFQPCLYPSPALWRSFRSRHLLPPNGLPMFNPDWTYRTPPPVGSAAAVPDNWLVAVLREDLHPVKEMDKMRRELEIVFGKERVVDFRNDMSLAESRTLFRHVVFFVTLQSVGLSNVIFLPPNATVLDFRPIPAASTEVLPPSKQDKVADIILARNFADACGVHLFAIICDGMASPPSCNYSLILDVIDKAAAAVFTSPAARAAAVAAAGDFSGLIPGSRLKSREQVEAFKSWMGCISREGSWQYDPTPRILPWNYQGGVNLCDIRHLDSGSGIAGEKADDVVRKKLPREEWKVRESLKYRWIVPDAQCDATLREKGSWLDFDPGVFCKRIGRNRTLLFLGDSLTDQMVDSFINNFLIGLKKPAFWAFEDVKLKDCIDWMYGKLPANNFCHEVMFHDGICPGFKVRFIRNDNLWLHNSLHAFDHVPWMRHSYLDDVDIIIMNRGAHYTSEEDFDQGMEDALAYTRVKYPSKLVIFRNTPPGHAHCEKYNGPIAKRQEASILPFDWDKFYDENKRIKKTAERHGVVVMDVDTMTALRPDGHKGYVEWKKKYDCLHYCTPGPVDLWVQLMYNILIHLL